MLGAAHLGTDVAAPSDHAAVYAVAPGVMLTAPNPHHFSVGFGMSHYYVYYHVRVAPWLHRGSPIGTGQYLGRVNFGMWHVHISEFVLECGWVDSRRPTGVLRDPANRGTVEIGPIHAFRSTATAWSSLRLASAPTGSDPGTRESLLDLHGVVDLQAAIVVSPWRRMSRFAQLPLAPSVVRGYLAPLGRPALAFPPVDTIDGSRMLPQPPLLWRYWAWGTYHDNDCYYLPRTTCGENIVWHVAAYPGFDTRSLPDGVYEYCVQALAVSGAEAARCSDVLIRNT